MIASGSSQNMNLLAQPGTIAFLVIFALGVVLFFVFRSMARHLRRVNQEARDEAQARFEQERAGGDGVHRDGEVGEPPGGGPANGAGT